MDLDSGALFRRDRLKLRLIRPRFFSLVTDGGRVSIADVCALDSAHDLFDNRTSPADVAGRVESSQEVWSCGVISLTRDPVRPDHSEDRRILM